jgi:transcriptional regulator with XRE-family HTH domain
VSQKAQQQQSYRVLPKLLRELREEAGLTQRELGRKLKKPQSWVYNCETANRRVDVTEFVLWAKACGVNAQKAFVRIAALLK